MVMYVNITIFKGRGGYWCSAHPPCISETYGFHWGFRLAVPRPPPSFPLPVARDGHRLFEQTAFENEQNFS